jgi:hypothetical protein
VTPEQAEAIARSAHEGQLDDSGIPVIEHVAAVAAAVPEDCKVIAWLHDVVEDCGQEYWDKACQSDMDWDDLVGVALLTRAERHGYWKYLGRICDHPADGGRKARIVKLADNLHNQSRPNPRPSMLERYKRAEAMLRAAMQERGEVFCATCDDRGGRLSPDEAIYGVLDYETRCGDCGREHQEEL